MEIATIRTSHDETAMSALRRLVVGLADEGETAATLFDLAADIGPGDKLDVVAREAIQIAAEGTTDGDLGTAREQWTGLLQREMRSAMLTSSSAVRAEARATTVTTASEAAHH